MKYQNILNDNKIKCTVCPRECVLAEGQRGFCHVRQNLNGNITLTSFGYTTGLNIDPIEKKPLYHFYPGSDVLSFGTIGCNMGCLFCQNYHISKSKVDPQLLEKKLPQEIAEIAMKKGCKSVAFTYNDPVIFLEYAIETAKECKARGIKTVAVTAGYINPEPRKEFFKYIDAANIDLKGFSEKFYKKNCLAHLEPILDTIKYVKNETDTWLELTTLLIDGENTVEREIEAQVNWILDNLGDSVPLHFSAFHPCYKFSDRKPTSPETLFKAYEIATKAGLRYVYLGNISNTQTSTTYCHNCKNKIIERNSYFITAYKLDEKGHCKFCKAKCEGVF